MRRWQFGSGPHADRVNHIDDRSCLVAGMQVISLAVAHSTKALWGVLWYALRRDRTSACKAVTARGDKSCRTNWLSIYPRSMFDSCGLGVAIQSKASSMAKQLHPRCEATRREAGEGWKDEF
jgi:hypothetical protein